MALKHNDNQDDKKKQAYDRYVNPEVSFFQCLKKEAGSMNNIIKAVNMLSREGVGTSQIREEVGDRLIKLSGHLDRYGKGMVSSAKVFDNDCKVIVNDRHDKMSNATDKLPKVEYLDDANDY